MARVKKVQNRSSGVNLGFETTLWEAVTIFRPLGSQKRVQKLNDE